MNLKASELTHNIESEPIMNEVKRTRLNNGVHKRKRIIRIKQLLYTTVDKSVCVSERMKEPPSQN